MQTKLDKVLFFSYSCEVFPIAVSLCVWWIIGSHLPSQMVENAGRYAGRLRGWHGCFNVDFCSRA